MVSEPLSWLAQRRTMIKTAGALLLSALFLLICVYGASAAPVSKVPITVTQPDGTALNLFVSGDEFVHWMEDEAGYTVVQDGAGVYVYAALEGDALAPTSLVVGVDDPAAAGLQPGVNISDGAMEARRDSLQALADASEHNPNRTGTINNLVIFVRFAGDAEYTTAKSEYNQLFNDPTPGAVSLWNYYLENSYNQLTVQSNFYPVPAGSTVVSCQDIHPVWYFLPFSAGNPQGYANDQDGYLREQALVAGAVNCVNKLGQFLDGATIDRNGDGEVDNVTIMLKTTQTAGTVVWPHRWFLSYSAASINGKAVKSYIVMNTSIFTVGTLAHEMGHTLGAPDLYHPTQTAAYQPVSQWDVMGIPTSIPQHMSCYTKYRYMGWVGLYLKSQSGAYTLSPLSKSEVSCYSIPSPSSGNEQFIVEYRRKAGSVFENQLWGSGLLVYRANNVVSGQGNYYGPPDELYLYRPGGTPAGANGSPQDAFFSQETGRVAINDATNPSSFLSNGGPGGLSLCSIGSAGETISFNICTTSGVNYPPILEDIPDITMDEDGFREIDLYPYVYDPNDDDTRLTFTILSSALPSGSQVTIDGHYLQIRPQANWCGENSGINVKATDPVGAGDNDWLKVNVQCVNDTPFIDPVVPDKEVVSGPITLNLTSYGWDMEDKGAALDWYVTGDDYVITEGEYSDNDTLIFWPAKMT